MPYRRFGPAFAAVLTLAGCGSDHSSTGPLPQAGAPQEVSARYEWMLQGFSGTTSVGDPTVQVTWTLPSGWSGEPFRVYGRRSDQGADLLLATVTSCAEGRCRYTDLNVAPGAQYEYSVVTLENGGRESPAAFRASVEVPPTTLPAPPQIAGADTAAVALDDALYLRWPVPSSEVVYYQVYLTETDGEPVSPLVQIGETDGTGYLDGRAQNGFRYGYRIASVNDFGQVGNLSAPLFGTPRPDAHAQPIFVYGDSVAASGFAFPSASGSGMVVPGDAPAAQWRLERVSGDLALRPLGETEVGAGVFTTALACGPGSDPDCQALRTAPASGYSNQPVPLDAELSYPLRVRGSDGQLHYAVVRVTLLGADAAGKGLMVFDWAYQQRPGVLQLDRVPR